MRRTHLTWPGRHSLRLGTTYLAIIMVMSIGFSFVIYHVSISKLHTQLEVHTLPNSSSPAGLAPPTPKAQIADSNEQLVAVRRSLRQALLVLNGLVLVTGSGLSYYLARRTLRPIEAALEVQARFAADASHELRTPLTLMQTELEVALRQSPLSPERAAQALRHSLQATKRLKNLSGALLQLTQGSHGLRLSPVVWSEIVGQAVNHTLTAAQAKHLAILDHVPSLSARGDTQSLVEALSILLDNAIKYSPERATITISGSYQGKHAYVHVHNEGSEIPPAELPHIFERFYRGKQLSQQKVAGHGLGLSIAQAIIKQHRGSITAASSPGKGVTFTIRLPRSL